MQLLKWKILQSLAKLKSPSETESESSGWAAWIAKASEPNVGQQHLADIGFMNDRYVAAAQFAVKLLDGPHDRLLTAAVHSGQKAKWI